MKRLLELIILLFRSISIYDILDAYIQPNNTGYMLSNKMFQMLANRQIPELSNDELNNLYNFLQNEVNDERQSISYGKGEFKDKNSLSPFDALLIISRHCLIEQRGEPLCKYENILLWRELSHELDADLFISAVMADNDIRNPREERSFAWRPVIRHNNVVLDRIVERGISENHLHLNGAAQYFQLSWINLMNQSEGSEFREVLNYMGRNRLAHEYSAFDYRNDSLYLRCRKAAALRLFLFNYIEGVKYNRKHNNTEQSDDTDRRNIRFKGDKSADFLTFEGIYKLLNSNEDEVEILCRNIDTYTGAISALCHATETKYDYAQYELSPHNGVNEYFRGERWLMYTILKEIYRGGRKVQRLQDLFHIYILLKESVRSELIQNNPVIGFDNFRLYQDRKSNLIYDVNLKSIYHRTAVYDTLVNQPEILSLEARVAPCETAAENYWYITGLDNNILSDIQYYDGHKKAEDKRKEFLNKFFYVYHFIKAPEDEKTLSASDLCRNSAVRKRVKEQAIALMQFRDDYRETARRVRGIDAANVEIGCRPEVFSQAFRVLRTHESPCIYGLPDSNKLHVTYHVGEDYVDLTDGLRAIDEAIKFLNMQCGDRLGHALALGVDPEEWYALKKGYINIPQQDYLDNIVWLYFKIIEYRIDVDNSLFPYLENEFLKYFRIIYKNNISDAYINGLLKNHSEQVIGSLDISTYYDAWKLRGDDPEIYIDGKYNNPEYTDIWEWNAINHIYPEEKRIRKNPATAFLYYLYHYNSGVKMEGRNCIAVEIPHMMQDAVAKVQLKMQREVACKGLCVEINLSSNCLIGTFGKYNYEKHPVLNLYNLGLGIDDEIGRQCSQVSVCINTDDPSVFGTSLENEYALIVRALESDRKSNGEHKYLRTSIYEWIDSIRKIGNDCVFRNE